MPASSTPNDLDMLSSGRNLMINNLSDGESFNPTWGDYTIDERLPSMSGFDTMFDFQVTDFATMDHSHGSMSPFDHGDSYGRELLDESIASRQKNTVSGGDISMISPEHMAVDHSSSNCQYRAYTTLTELYCRTKHSFGIQDGQSDQTNGLPSPLTDGSSFSSPIPPTMDKVLSANKAALATLMELLDCTCAHDPHLAFLYASIVFKVLLWYRIASGIRPSSDHFAAASSSSDQSAPTIVESCKSSSAGLDFQANDILPTKIQVGGHILDEDDQTLLRRDLLLREVQKVGRVIDRMAPLGEDQHLANSQGNKASTWYSMASTNLREDLENTINKIKDIGISSRGGER